VSWDSRGDTLSLATHGATCCIEGDFRGSHNPREGAGPAAIHLDLERLAAFGVAYQPAAP
jgi:hypothetical protein